MDKDRQAKCQSQSCCNNRVCNFCFPYAGCGCAIWAFLSISLVLTAQFTVRYWMVAIGGVVGPEFQRGTREAFIRAVPSGNYEAVQEMYNANWFLDHSAVIMGTNASGPLGGFVGTRGWSDSIKIDVDRKMRVASASKWLSATVVYAVMEHPLTNFSRFSRPGEYFSFWTCPNAQDIRCNNITVDNLLAFRSGLAIAECEYTGPRGGDWEQCVEKIFSQPYEAARLNEFEYGPVGLAVAGLMALKEMQKLSGFETANWDDLLRFFILDKAGIEPAPTFDTRRFENGNMTYDNTFEEGLSYNPSFPGLSGSVGCSPRQYAQFAHAFLANELVSEATVTEMTTSRGPVPAYFGLDLPQYKGYCQGMWSLGTQQTHSLGLYGFFPWLDRAHPDPSRWYFGIVAVDNQDLLEHHWTYVSGFLVPALLIPFAWSTIVCFRSRSTARLERERSIVGGKPLVADSEKRHSL